MRVFIIDSEAGGLLAAVPHVVGFTTCCLTLREFLLSCSSRAACRAYALRPPPSESMVIE